MTFRATALAITALLVLAAAPASAKKPRPLPCKIDKPLRFFSSPSVPLIVGSTAPTDAVVIDGGEISIGTACQATGFKLKAKKAVATTITAKFAFCTGLLGKVVLKADLTVASSCRALTGTLKAKRKKHPFAATLSTCGDGIRDPDNAEACDGSPCDDGRACMADCTCSPLPPTTSSTVVSVPTTTSTTLPLACCGAERITLTSTAGALLVDGLVFPFPAGVVTTLDVGPAAPALPECRHGVIVPAGGFTVPHFDVPALDYCSEIIDLGCEEGDGDGAGALWDGNGAAGMAMTSVSKVADTSDGVCDPNPFVPGICDSGTNQGKPCVIDADCPPDGMCTSNCNPAGLGHNTLGDVDTTRGPSTTRGIRTAVDMRLRSLTWKAPSDVGCHPSTDPGCCLTANYGDNITDEVIANFDFVVSATTDVATAQFVDKNGDGCSVAGRGFNDPPIKGPRTLTGSPAPGPCCSVDQTATLVSVGASFSDFEPFSDLGFQLTMPSRVTSCGTPAASTCVVTTDPCMQ